MTINQHELHLWHASENLVQESSEAAAQCSKVLSAEEADKAKHFRFKNDQHQYLLAHGMLRLVLSHYDPTITPQEWLFNKNQYGKWSIANNNRLALTFNLSHTKGGVVILVSRNAEIGVDIENTHNSMRTEEGRLLSIAENFFSTTEVDDLLKQPIEAQQRYFLQLWTLKESYIKAIGKGLSADLKEFSFQFIRPNQLSFIDHSHGSTLKTCRSWHYQSNHHSLLSLSSLNMNEAQEVVFIDFAQLNQWGASNDHFYIVARS